MKNELILRETFLSPLNVLNGYARLSGIRSTVDEKSPPYNIPSEPRTKKSPAFSGSFEPMIEYQKRTDCYLFRIQRSTSGEAYLSPGIFRRRQFVGWQFKRWGREFPLWRLHFQMQMNPPRELF